MVDIKVNNLRFSWLKTFTDNDLKKMIIFKKCNK